MTFTRAHTYVSLADPNLRCDRCGEPVPRYHDPDKCGCEGQFRNVPCGHVGVLSVCSSWGPVDGCRCEGHPHADVATPPGASS